jgi:hypothetical protein
MLTAEKIIKEAIVQLEWEAIEDVKNITGVYPDLTNEQYHSMKNYISRSALMDFDKSPYTYWAKHINPDRPKKDATPQMELGSAFHTLILEPHLFADQYVIKPPRVLLKDVGREAYDDFKRKELELESTNKIVLSQEDYLNLLAMEKKIRSNDQAMQLIEGARIEHSLFWQDEHSGLFLKSRPDIWHDNMIVDLKTTSDASPRAFQFEMVKYGYHVQFAMIRDAIEKIEGRFLSHFIDLVIESKYPHNMAIYMIDEFAIDEGQVKYKNICLDLKNSTEENNFKDYGIQTIGLPRWAT